MFGGHGYMTECRVVRARMGSRVPKIWAGSHEVVKD
ncbi:hypothetical protein [Streptomyces sp. WM6372]